MQNMSSWNHISSMPHTGRQECILAPLCVNDSVLSFSIIIIRWFSCIPLKFRTFLVNETMKSDFAACQAPTLIRLTNKINVASFIARSFMITSTKRSPVYAVGGGSRDARWGQMISDLLQSPPTSMMPCWQCAGLFMRLQRVSARKHREQKGSWLCSCFEVETFIWSALSLASLTFGLWPVDRGGVALQHLSFKIESHLLTKASGERRNEQTCASKVTWGTYGLP